MSDVQFGGVSGKKADERCFGLTECSDNMQCATLVADGKQQCQCNPTYVTRLAGSCGTCGI